MVFAFELVEDHEIEERVVHRHRDVVLHLIPERARKLCLVHLGNVHLANHDALVGNPDGDPLALELPLLPKVSDHRRDRLGVRDLSADDRARRKGQLREANEDTGGCGQRHRQQQSDKAEQIAECKQREHQPDGMQSNAFADKLWRQHIAFHELPEHNDSGDDRDPAPVRKKLCQSDAERKYERGQ